VRNRIVSVFTLADERLRESRTAHTFLQVEYLVRLAVGRCSLEDTAYGWLIGGLPADAGPATMRGLIASRATLTTR
jgi:hypothetical protein